jgi:perosamine synthetase
VTLRIPQMEPLVTETDAAAVTRYLASGGWLTEFHETRAFEAAIREYTGARYVLAAPSGTLALFLALKGLGVGPGDEVVVPDLTMAASATAVLLAGAAVVFADIDPETLCLDLVGVERSLTPRTRAIMFVSLNGRSPAGLAAAIAGWRARGLAVIEDAAQSLGSWHAGRHLGTLGDCGCLSFSSQKIVTTGQGGAVLTDDAALFERLSLLRDFGRREGGSDRYEVVGWNLKFTDLQAVIGRSQMARLPAIVARKRATFARYRDRLAGLGDITLPATDLDQVTPWFVDALLPDAEVKGRLAGRLREQGIGSRPFYPPLHAEPAFAAPGACPAATEMSARGLWLPSSLRLTDADIDRVCDAIGEHLSG